MAVPDAALSPLPEIDLSDLPIPAYGPDLILTLAPRMEASKVHREITVPSMFGWSVIMRKLLKITRISPAGTTERVRRCTLKGKDRVPLKAKDCAPGLLPYRMPEGVARGVEGAALMDQWGWLPLDLDGVPLPVRELIAIVRRAFADWKHASVTTWSCTDGDARLRILIPLARTCTYAEVCDLFWLARAKLIAAGLPEQSVKPGEPTVDSRLDPKLFYAPSVPTPMMKGVEGWGGTIPIGHISPDDVPLLDPDLVLDEAREIRAATEAEHLARWPGVPIPGGAGAAKAKGFKVSKSKAKGEATDATQEEPRRVVRSDWGKVQLAGTGLSLRAWAEANLAPGTEASVGSPWRDDGGSGLAGKSLRVHRDLDGRLMGYDFPRETTHHDLGSIELFEGFDLDWMDEGGLTCPEVEGFEAVIQDDRGEKCVNTLLISKEDDGCVDALLIPSNADNTSKSEKSFSDETPPLKMASVLWGLADLVGEKYIPALPLRARVTFLRAPHGSGKTERTRAIVDRLLLAREEMIGDPSSEGDVPGPIISVVHRRTLARQQAHRLSLPNYETINGEIDGDVIVCLDSLRRVALHTTGGSGELRPVRPALVILDEVDQIVHHLFGGTLAGPMSLEAAERLRSLLGGAKQILCMSADLDSATIKMIRLLMGRDPEAVGDDEELRVLKVPHARPWRIDVDPSRTDKDLFAEWIAGKNLAIHAQSRRECGRLAKQLAELRPDASILLITSETVSNREVQSFLADPSLAKDYDAIVYSPSLGTGYSIDVVGHIHRVYAYSRVGVGTATDLVQGAMRARNPIDPEIRVACPRGGSTTRETDPARIYAALCNLGDATIRTISPDGSVMRTSEHVVGTEVIDDDGVIKVDPWRTWHTMLYARVLSRERKLGGPGGARHTALLAYLSAIGATVEVTEPIDADESKGIKAEAKEARAEVRQERAERIATAPHLTITEARKISEPKDQAEADSIERAYVADFYGDATVETVLADDEGKLRGEARNFARLTAFVRDPEAVISLDRWERKHGYPASHAGFFFVGAKVSAKVLAAAGLVGDPILWGGIVLDPKVIGAKVAKVARKFKPELGELGITVRGDVEDKPLAVINAILSKIGLSTREKRSGDQRTYTVSAGDVEHMASVSARYLARVLDRDPAGRMLRDPLFAELDAMEAEIKAAKAKPAKPKTPRPVPQTSVMDLFAEEDLFA